MHYPIHDVCSNYWQITSTYFGNNTVVIAGSKRKKTIVNFPIDLRMFTRMNLSTPCC